MLIDTHAHLHFPDFSSELEQVIGRAQQAGVSYFLNIGTDSESSQKSVALAEQYDFIYASAGVHPHDVEKADSEEMARIEALLTHPKVVAIGEIGLDFYRHLSPEAVQRKVLIQFFELSKKYNLPMVLHIRDAYEAMLEMLQAHFKPPVAAVCHCYSSTAEVMKKFVDLGLYISFAGPVTYKKNDELRKAAKACPKDRILIETDAPFLPPQSMRGKRNEPALIKETASVIAEIRGETLEQFGNQVIQNAKRLFGKMK